MIRNLAELKADILNLTENLSLLSYFPGQYIYNQEVDQLEAKVQELTTLSCKSLQNWKCTPSPQLPETEPS